MKYLKQFESVRDTVEQLSPYHYYQDRYWKLRGHWRKLLFDWTRREPCDAKVELDRDHYLAGSTDTLTFTYTVGSEPWIPGTRIALYFPIFLGGIEHLRELATFQGPDGQAGYGARIVAEPSVADVVVHVNVHSVGSVFTCVEVVFDEGCLESGGTLRMVVGDTLANKPPVISEKAQTLTFRTAVDFKGDDQFRPIKPDIILPGRGNTAIRLDCRVAATPKPGEAFALKITAADSYNGNPAYAYSGRLSISATGAPVNGPDAFTASESAHGSLTIDGLSVASANGVSRVVVLDTDNAVMGVSNPVCPAATPPGLSLYYGEIHAHTELSDGVGTPDDAMRWGRDVERLDFAGLADHFERGQSYNETREEKWQRTRRVIERYNNPGRFATLLGYELGTLEAHRNVYFPNGDGRMIVDDEHGDTVTMDNVYDKLEGEDYILIPHAPKYHGINWRAQHRPERQRLVEICSAWGISEEGGPLSVRAGLDLGLKLGFTGGTDNHSAEPAHAFYAGFGGLTGVFAKELTREEIFTALMARRTFATNGCRMILNFNINDHFMGEETNIDQVSKVVVQGRAITMAPIQGIDIIRNGEVVHTLNPREKCDELTVEWTDPDGPHQQVLERELTGEKTLYYYLRIRAAGDSFGWTSPIWINRL
ncbi:MAG: DUF3604 domain-containing protein [Candidatus Marinimicrobia bacterium]|nr:DUF3604 domain-containing protein [Candidatus Neomarinimicrobiota bacterium]